MPRQRGPNWREMQPRHVTALTLRKGTTQPSLVQHPFNPPMHVTVFPYGTAARDLPIGCRLNHEPALLSSVLKREFITVTAAIQQPEPFATSTARGRAADKHGSPSRLYWLPHAAALLHAHCHAHTRPLTDPSELWCVRVAERVVSASAPSSFRPHRDATPAPVHYATPRGTRRDRRYNTPVDCRSPRRARDATPQSDLHDLVDPSSLGTLPALPPLAVPHTTRVHDRHPRVQLIHTGPCASERASLPHCLLGGGGQRFERPPERSYGT